MDHKEIQKAIEVFKAYEKLGSRNPTNNDRAHYQVLYDAVLTHEGHRTKVIDWSCSGCISRAMGVIYNFVNYIYEAPQEKEEIEVNSALIERESVDYSQMKLKQLRKLFPEIKANSVAKFVELIPK